MPCLSKTARPQISAVSLPAIPVCTGSPFLRKRWTSSYPNPPVLLSRLCRSQSQTEFRPIRRRCPPDTGRQRRLFFVLLSHIGLFQRHGMMTGRLGIVPSFSMLARYLVSIFTFSAKSFRARFFAFRASFTSAPKVSKPGQSFTFAIQHHPHTFYVA